MARLRYNNALGTLGGSGLTDGTGTTITFASAPAFATIVSPDYIPLVIDPPSGSAPSNTFEVVYLTAYTASATTGTIVRGCEGTTGVAHAAGATWECGPTQTDAALATPSGLQNGVVGSSDLAVSSVSLNTSTGALTFTLAAGKPCWVADANGILVPVWFPGAAYTITPSLPASTKYAVIGVEVDTLGKVTLIKGTDTSSQLNTGSLIAANTPATTAGKLRVADFAYWNNSGTIDLGDHTTTAAQGVNWIDRRPWARGARYRYDRGNVSAYTIATNVAAAIDSTNISARIESCGNPVRAYFSIANCNVSGTGAYVEFRLYVDGVQVSGNADQSSNTTEPYIMAAVAWEITPAAGSHLYQIWWLASSGTATLYAPPLSFVVEEIVCQNANNGIA